MMRSRRRQAAALILVLWGITVLAMLAAGLTFSVRQEVAVSGLHHSRIAAHALARAGVERTIAALMDDLTGTDSMDDAWWDDASLLKGIPLSGGTFDVIHGSHDSAPIPLYGAEDESGKLNVNTATREQLMRLPDMTETIAGAIIDWRDGNQEPESDGIEGSYYEGLSHPYRIRDGMMRTMRELLLVRDVSPELFLREDTNGNGLLDTNEDDGRASPPMDNADGRLDRGWLAWITIYSYESNTNSMGAKRLNIKTADANALSQTLGLESWAANSIVKARQNKEFTKLVDLLDVQRDTSTPTEGSQEEDMNSRGEGEKSQPVTEAIFKRIVDDITLSDETTLAGRININTAAPEVLRTLPDVDEAVSDAIVRMRGSAGGFSSIGELFDIQGMTKEKFGRIESLVTVRSTVFRIISRGQSASGLAQSTIECVVDRGGEVPKVLYWLESTP